MHPYRASSSPAHFYAATNEYVLCLERATGKEVWRTHAFGAGTIITLLLVDDRLFAASAGAAACLDASSGKVLWSSWVDRLGTPASIAYDPSVAPGGQIFLSSPGMIFSLDASSGKVLWTNGLEGLNYYHVSLRVPGAITSQPLWHQVSTGKSSHTEVLEDDQG